MPRFLPYRLLRNLLIAAVVLCSQPAGATYHLWVIDQLFSNASGTVQFIELTALSGSQQFLLPNSISTSQGSSTHSFSFPTNLPGDTTGKKFLIATEGFKSLGIVTPDYTVPNGFLFTPGGTINYANVDFISYTALPTDGTHSIDRNGNVKVNSATNFAGASGSVTASGTGGAGTIVEYYWPNGDNYFITADPAEQASLDAASTASGHGLGTFNRTGVTFAAGGLTQVCRFAGNNNIKPGTGLTYGPTSHFYTVFAEECTALQAAFNPNAMSWRLESPAGAFPPPFFMTRPTVFGVGGSCPAGTTPVYRAYDNSQCVGVSSVCVPQPNHRITTDLNAINQVVARGWTNEGVIMCAPASADAGAPPPRP